MPLDPSIILQAGRGVTPLKDPSEIATERAQRELQMMQLQQARQGMTDDQTARQIAMNTGGAELPGAYQKAGLLKQAQQAQTFQNDQQKSAYERGKQVTDAMKVAAEQVMQNPTEQSAIAALEDISKRYGIPAQHFDAGKAAIYAAQNDPNKIRQLMGGLGAKADEALGKIENQNLGGVNSIQRTNPYTGQTEVLGTQARTQSPDSVASTAQSAANAAMTDARARELNATRARSNVPSGYEPDPDKPGALRPISGGPNDPLTKPAGGKPLNDTQAKALQFGSRMQASGEILDRLAADGVTTSVPGSRAGYGVGAVVSAMQPESRQQLDQAKRDFINAVLRRESGAAISESEFENAEKQYFPQPNEGAKQQAQKKANRELATRGILAEVPDAENRVASVRGIPNKGGATGDFGAPATPKGPQPKTKPVNVAGQDHMAELAPDGKYYVQKNGKWFEVR